MKRVVLFLLLFCGISLLFFLSVQKPLFLIYNGIYGSGMEFADVISIYKNGFALDVSAACYMTAVPLLLCWIGVMCQGFNMLRWLRGYTILISFVVVLISCADAYLYEFWEFKLDNTVFLYLDDPKNAFASVTVPYIVLRTLLLAGLSCLLFMALSVPQRLLSKNYCWPSGKRWKKSCVMIVMAALVFVGIRGVRVWPNTPARAYYSSVQFFNHTAVNPLENVIYSMSKRNDFSSQFRFFDSKEVTEVCAELFPLTSDSVHVVIDNRHPDVVVIVLEGFGSLFIESLGGMEGVAPNMSRLCDESFCFTHCYCSSFRTDRGIVSAISGYPGQPTTSIMRYTHKIKKLPGLPKSLKRAGYRTAALYGGDASFFNMSDWMLASGHDRIVSINDFPKECRTTEWGVPDHVMFDYLFRDLNKEAYDSVHPRYMTLLTISSHSPFDVPYHRLSDPKLNAFAYTDSCMGDFVNRLRLTPAWDNLLIVVTADHGFNHNRTDTADFPFIPLLLTGGAVNVEPCRVDKLVNQTDIPAIVLGQLGLPHDEYLFSRDVLAKNYRYPFAFNTFNNGFNYRDNTGCTVWDNVADKAIEGDDRRRERLGKTILQQLYSNLSGL
ncbi:MAG: sulfatase-like hydrolase/transferase [Muribaculaceae bacterium]|nr:sulfatase-like hydrolase/transferase [Muribaculaceae bacterium]